MFALTLRCRTLFEALVAITGCYLLYDSTYTRLHIMVKYYNSLSSEKRFILLLLLILTSTVEDDWY